MGRQQRMGTDQFPFDEKTSRHNRRYYGRPGDFNSGANIKYRMMYYVVNHVLTTVQNQMID